MRRHAPEILALNDNEMVAFKKVWCKYEIVVKCPFRRLEKNEETDVIN